MAQPSGACAIHKCREIDGAKSFFGRIGNCANDLRLERSVVRVVTRRSEIPVSATLNPFPGIPAFRNSLPSRTLPLPSQLGMVQSSHCIGLVELILFAFAKTLVTSVQATRGVTPEVSRWSEFRKNTDCWKSSVLTAVGEVTGSQSTE